jgi:glycosyltransferase involved in cell wall biosynthesis
MRIALITDGIWPYVLGGMQKHSYYLCKYLAQQKVQVDLFHFNQSEYDINKLEFFTEAEKAFIKATVVPFPDSAKGYGQYLINSYRYSFNVYEVIKDSLNAYDFIYTKGFAGWHFVREKSRSQLPHPPIGVKFHGYEMFQKAPGLKAKLQQILLLRKPVKEISQKADVVFSYGGKITDIIKSIGVPGSKIIELPSGVEASIVADSIIPTGKKIKFLFLGRYERRKGIEELNKAILTLGNKNFAFHFIGPIPDEKQVQSQNVKYHGEIRDKRQLNQLIKQCDVLVCPSWSEGMPNVILEAMANGLSVIATNVGATNVMVNENTGWLIGQCSSKEIRHSLQKVIQSEPSQIDLKKQNALNHIKENFIWENLIVKLIDKIKVISGKEQDHTQERDLRT